MQGITVLGSTGSIGISTLDVISRNKDKYKVVALTANTQVERLYEQCLSFEPEYAGKMNFYLNLLDDHIREPDENQSIGIILCADRDKVEVEYALRGIGKPVGVAEYRLTKELPPELAENLPDAKLIGDEILKELNAEHDDQED